MSLRNLHRLTILGLVFFILGLLGVVIFSLTLPFTRIVVQEIHPLLNGLGRALLSVSYTMSSLSWLSSVSSESSNSSDCSSWCRRR